LNEATPEHASKAYWQHQPVQWQCTVIIFNTQELYNIAEITVLKIYLVFMPKKEQQQLKTNEERY
jgi:hypothetical protein